jgi:UDP-N-acetyl-D-galactosamine dehydrogenase
LDIDTEEVLLAAGTKWNFLPFRPGLVGGHCIGVDPYYLTYKAQLLDYQPKIILAGRHLNDSMGKYVADKLIERMKETNTTINGAKILIMGLTFKENCPDMRNTRVLDIAEELIKHGANVDAHDPWVSEDLVEIHENVALKIEPEKELYDAIIIAVSHEKFAELGVDVIRSYGKKDHILFDLKYLFAPNESDLRF